MASMEGQVAPVTGAAHEGASIHQGNIGQANHAAAKSGLFGLTSSLALETARIDINGGLCM